MKKSKDVKAQSFLDDVMLMCDEKFDIVQALRDIVFDACQSVCERILYGGIMFSQSGEDWGGIFVYKEHVSFEFGNGVTLKDPQKSLIGVGKLRRHLKFTTLNNIDEKEIISFIKQSIHA